MFRAQKTVAAAAATAKRELKKLSRPAGEFDASRYFRDDHTLGFYNTGTKPMRTLARAICVEPCDCSLVAAPISCANL